MEKDVKAIDKSYLDNFIQEKFGIRFDPLDVIKNFKESLEPEENTSVNETALFQTSKPSIRSFIKRVTQNSQRLDLGQASGKEFGE